MKTTNHSLRSRRLSESSRIDFLPNLFTAGNLFFGFLAIISCIQAKYVATDEVATAAYYTEAVWLIIAAFVCDILDGRIARSMAKESAFGQAFDSIADVVSFGVAPALMVFFLILKPTENFEYFQSLGWLIGFIYLLCAAIRLARFNVLNHELKPLSKDKKSYSNKEFLGLPTPAAAGLIVSLVLVLNQYELREWSVVLLLLMLFITGLMVSNIPYPSFKDLGWRTRTHFRTFIICTAMGIASVLLLRSFALVGVFLCYIFYGPLRLLYRAFYRRRKVSVQ